MPSGIQQARIDQSQKIAAEPPAIILLAIDISRDRFTNSGDTFANRVNPGAPRNSWSERKGKARAGSGELSFGSDNNYEYKLWGSFSGQTVYEPASNGFYQEFVLKKYELISTNPAPIFKSQYSDRPGRTPRHGNREARVASCPPRNSRDKLVESFFASSKWRRNVSPRTLSVYRQALAAFRTQKNVRSWEKCTADDFRDYLFA